MDDIKDKANEANFKYKEFIPYAGSVIIFLGAFRLIMFYGGFGVSIVQFLDFSEIITSFLDIIIPIVIMLCITIFQNFILHDKKKYEKYDSLRNEILSRDQSFKDIKLYLRYFKDLLIISLAIIIVFTFLYFYNKIISFNTVKVTVILLLFLFFVLNISLMIERKYIENNTSKKGRTLIRIFSNSIICVLVVLALSQFQIYNTKYNHSTKGTKIVLENDDILLSDNINYYIGKTVNYVFYYHEKTKTTDVIPISRVKQLSIKNKYANSYLSYIVE